MGINKNTSLFVKVKNDKENAQYIAIHIAIRACHTIPYRNTPQGAIPTTSNNALLHKMHKCLETVASKLQLIQNNAASSAASPAACDSKKISP